MSSTEVLPANQPRLLRYQHLLSPSHFWLFTFLLVLFALLIFVWFGVFNYTTFMGDDLQVLYLAQHNGYASSFWGSFVQTGANKYRPVLTVLFSLEVKLFGDNLRAYISVNMLVELANVGLVAWLAWQLAAKRWLVALGAGLMMIVARFNNYYVLQMHGLMEGLALFFMLLAIYGTWRAYRLKTARAYFWPSAAYFLAIYTHERYLLLLGFLVLSILLAPATFKHWGSRLGWATLPLIVAITNYIVKVLILKVNFLEGSQGRKLEFSFSQFVSYLTSGFLNMLGFNVGPDYLSGLDIINTAGRGYLNGALMLAPVLILAGAYFLYLLRLKRRCLLVELRNFILFMTLFAPMLAGASITAIQDYRFLYTPYALIILGLAYLIGRTALYNWLRLVLTIWLVLAALNVDIFYRAYVANIYFIRGQNFAESARTQMIEPYGANLLNYDVYYITGGDPVPRQWYFGENYFIQTYTKNPQSRFNYVDNLDSVAVDQKKIERTLIFTADNGIVSNVSLKARTLLVERAATSGATSFDFIADFAKGKINSTEKVATPTGQGVLELPWPGELGATRTMTILSGFNYRYEGLKIVQGNILLFTAGVTYDSKITDGAQAYIAITPTGGTSRRVFAADLAPVTNDSIQWRTFRVPMNDFAGQSVTITFGVDSPSGNPSGDWIAFSSARLVASK